MDSVTIKKSFPHLYPFQVATVKDTLTFFNHNETRAAYNANPQGLGKSITTIATLDLLTARSEIFRTLIVCPAVMRYVWLSELVKFSTFCHDEARIVVIDTKKDIRKLSTNPYVVICSYDLAHTADVLPCLEEYLKGSLSFLVNDEAFYLKNYKAKRTKALLKVLFPKARYKLFLAGTPFTVNVVDAYPTFAAILPKLWPDFFTFAGEYAYRRVTNWGTSFEGLKNPDKLKSIIRSNFFIRFNKADVLPELPSKQYTDVWLPETLAVVPASKDEKKQLALEVELIRQAILNGRDIPVPRTLAEHRKLQGIAKCPEVAAYVEELLEQKLPVVLMLWHKECAKTYEVLLAKYKPVVITGETPAKERAFNVSKFQSGGTDLILCNMLAGGVGITLHRSSNVVLAELAWSPAVVDQAICRVDRIGQKNQVVVHTILVKNSIDGAVADVLLRRVKEFNKLLE